MAKRKKRVERVSATLSTGTRVTAPQEVVDKVKRQDAKAQAKATSPSK